jgi:3'(2'), 5'-bisphosphate nucleotidase
MLECGDDDRCRHARRRVTEHADDAAAARRIAAAAGALLLELRAGLEVGIAPDTVRSNGDRRSHELIMSLLRGRFPDDPVLSEEGGEAPFRRDAGRVWIVDPLDGTREFGEAGRRDWAVHVALVVEGALVAGAVALPARGVVFATDAPPPAPAVHPGAVRVVASRTRPGTEAARLADAFEGQLVPMGSAGAKIMAVVEGDADIYLHSGGQHVWDSAAPVAVAAAAGIHTSRLDGSPLDYRGVSTWLPDILVCRHDLRDRVLNALGCG